MQSGFFQIFTYHKGDKQLLQNYWPVSLLAIGKNFLRELFSTQSLNLNLWIWVKIVSKSLNLGENNLLCPSQSGFHLLDSCENQLLSIIQDIYANFDQHPTLEVRANFFNFIAFGKVWHEGLLFKFEHNWNIRKSGNLLKSILSYRFQWDFLKACVRAGH